MSIPSNRMSYADIYEVYDQALADPRGIRLPFDNMAAAKTYQMRMHNARAVDRKENSKVYPKDDPMFGQSQYDVLQVRVVGPIKDEESPTGETVFLYIEPKDKNRPDIERLSEIEEDNGASI